MITVEEPRQIRPETSAEPDQNAVRTHTPGIPASVVLSALTMAAVSIALAAYQLFGSTLASWTLSDITVSKPVPPPAASIEPLPPEPLAPEPPPQQAEPPVLSPAISDERLAAMAAEAQQFEHAIAADRGKLEGASAAVSEALDAWKRLNRTAASSEIAAKTAGLQRDAAVAGIRSLRKRYEELARETAEVLKTPKPPREALSGFSPVAKPAKGQEYHFEVRAGHVAFIDLQQLLELVKKDVQIRMRLSGSPRGIQSEVGPVGEFGLAYEIGPMNDMLGGTGVGLKGWEIVPARDPRGESAERAAQPLSEFDRAIRRLSPSSATITMWVYPDGFDLFRILRDRLHAQGFMVAARPLPEGVPVRGSPMGSISAGQ